MNPPKPNKQVQQPQGKDPHQKNKPLEDPNASGGKRQKIKDSRKHQNQADQVSKQGAAGSDSNNLRETIRKKVKLSEDQEAEGSKKVIQHKPSAHHKVESPQEMPTINVITSGSSNTP